LLRVGVFSLPLLLRVGVFSLPPCVG